MGISQSGSEDFLAAFFVENLLKYEQICGIINVAGILPHDGSCFLLLSFRKSRLLSDNISPLNYQAAGDLHFSHINEKKIVDRQ